MRIRIEAIEKSDYPDLSLMVGELLSEIMVATNQKAFNYDQSNTLQRINDFIALDKYWAFVAKETKTGKNTGFVSLCESFALYSEGSFGTITELYVRPEWRSNKIGHSLLLKANEFARSKKWHRIEVNTPPLPEFDKTFKFYQRNGFVVSGGRKLKIDPNT